MERKKFREEKKRRIKFAENLMEIGHITREEFDEKIEYINSKYW